MGRCCGHACECLCACCRHHYHRYGGGCDPTRGGRSNRMTCARISDGHEALPPAVFLDKDGLLLADVTYNVEPRLMQLAPGAREALQIFSRLAVPLYVISNQSGVAMGKFPVEALDAVETRLNE